jgi:hypothetical protein
MKHGDPRPVVDVLYPKLKTIETVASSSRPVAPEATIDGFSFATHSVGNGPRRRLGFSFKLIAWILLGLAALGLIAQAGIILFSLLYT